MKRRTLTGVVLLATFVLLASADGLAQTGQNFGELVGKAVDEQGGVLPGVIVTLTGPAVMGAQTATTNERGIYRFPALPTGTYRISFDLSGFQTLVREGIVVSVRTTITIDATMKVASLTETVTVTGQSPVVDAENAKVGQRLEQAVLQEVPTQRSIFGMTTVLPGMVMNRQDVGGLYSITSTGMVAHGASGYNLNYFGVTADTPANYGAMYYMDFGSAQEISIDTAAMGADIGGGGGANINVIPKSGGNQFQGSFYFTGTSSGLAGDNVDDRLRKQGITRGTAMKKLLDFNADAGAPIKRDKVWWYASYRRFSAFENIIGFDKDFQSRNINYSTRINFKLSKNNDISLYWTQSGKFQPNRDAGRNRLASSTQLQDDAKNLFNVSSTSVVTQNSFLEISSSLFRMWWPQWYATEWDKKTPASYDTATGNYWGAYYQGERDRDSWRWQLNGAITNYKDGWLGGNHQFKAGYEWWIGWGPDAFNIYNDTLYYYRNGVPNQIWTFNTPLTQQSHMKSIAVFGQDRITYERVSLTLGLRYAFYDGYVPEQSGGGGRWFPTTTYPKRETGFNWQSLAPRLGVVWKLTADGTNVVKANYAQYYNHMFITDYNDIINPNLIRTTGMINYTWLGDLNGNGVVDPGEYNPTPLSVFVPRNNSIDPNFKSPRTDEYTIGYQRELMANLGFSVSWIQRWFTRDRADVNVGVPPEGYEPRVFNDPGPDNLTGTSDDRPITLYARLPQYAGQDKFVRKNIPGTMTYKALEMSVTRRMANHFQIQGSYVWSRYQGTITGLDPNDLNTQIASNKYGVGTSDQPHAFKLLGSYQAPLGITLGVNWQWLSGLYADRTFRATLPQGTVTVRAEERGVYRRDTLKLLSIKADKRFRLHSRATLSGFFEFHNLLNMSTAQGVDALTQGFASQQAFETAMSTTQFFGRVTEILPPRLVKLGIKWEW